MVDGGIDSGKERPYFLLTLAEIRALGLCSVGVWRSFSLLIDESECPS